MSKRLYQIRCRGMQTSIGGDVAYGHAFVVAEDPNEAYSKLRKSLDDRNLGFTKERVLLSIELVAEQEDYPGCGMILYL